VSLLGQLRFEACAKISGRINLPTFGPFNKNISSHTTGREDICVNCGVRRLRRLMKASTSDQGRNPCSSLALIRLLFYSSHHLSSRFRFPSTFVSLQNRRHLAPSPRHQTKSGIDTLASKRAQERCSLIHRLLLVPGCCKVKISSFFSPCAGSSCLSSLFPLQHF
jgi:hypothetical protein